MRPRFHRIRYALLPLFIGLYASPIATAQTAQSSTPPIEIPRLSFGHTRISRGITFDWDDTRRELINEYLHRTPSEVEGWSDFDQAYLQWEAGQKEDACKTWTRIVIEFSGTELAFDAQWNLAESARLNGNRSLSLRLLKDLLKMSPSVKLTRRDLYDIQNEKNFACLELSDLYLEINDIRSSLHYAQLALQKYQYSGECAFFNDAHSCLIEDRIAALETAVKQSQTVTIEPRSDATEKTIGNQCHALIP